MIKFNDSYLNSRKVFYLAGMVNVIENMTYEGS